MAWRARLRESGMRTVWGTAGDPPADGAETADRLRLYLDELYRWNRRVNLTSVPREQAERRHADEARRLLDELDAANGLRLVDIGSGAGIPGLVIAILRPDLRVTLVEADALCSCSGVEVVAARAESVGRDPARREGYDLAVSRAAAPAPVLCELALPLLRVGGRLVTLVGDAASEAEAAAFAAIACGGEQPVALAAGILSVRKVAPTPERFPRRPGVPG